MKILKKKSNEGRLDLPDIKTYTTATIIKTMVPDH